ncbi:MAG: hypothetical protein AB9907_09835 [Flexilinea sp.]
MNTTPPASYTLSWTSTNAASCVALNNLSGVIANNESRAFSNIRQGAYRYTVQCINTAGTSTIDSVLVNVNPLPPVVDLKIESGDTA